MAKGKARQAYYGIYVERVSKLRLRLAGNFWVSKIAITLLLGKGFCKLTLWQCYCRFFNH